MGIPKKKSAETFVKDIRNNTRRIFTTEQKVLIVMEALRAEISITELYRKYSINQSCMYSNCPLFADDLQRKNTKFIKQTLS